MICVKSSIRVARQFIYGTILMARQALQVFNSARGHSLVQLLELSWVFLQRILGTFLYYLRIAVASQIQ